MYDTTYKCTYNLDNIFTEKEKHLLTQQEKDFVLNCLYRNDLLYIFDLDDFNNLEEMVNNELYEKVKHDDFFLSCMKKLNEKYMILKGEFREDDDTDMLGLILLYSFDYLYLTHPCISDLLETGVITDENKNALLNKVFELL